MLTRRHALSLASVLAAVVLTGGAAILGIARAPSQHHVAPAAIVQAPQPTAQQWEEGD